MYLCKIAMDIVAKHIAPDKDGVRIAGLDEPSYRRLLWGHRPLTDFWRVGRGYARKLESLGLYTMGDIARCSLGSEDDFYNEELLYSQFGKNTELLIDHAWGYEPCTIADIKAYKPERHSVGSGQVLSEPYTYDRALLIVKEMTDLLALDLVDKGFVTNQIVMTVGYDIENLKGSKGERYIGNVEADAYGRKVPKSAHGTENISEYTSATSRLMKAATELYARIVNPDLLVRRIYLTANNILTEQEAKEKKQFRQMSLFEDFDLDSGMQIDHRQQEKEKNIQSAVNEIKKKYGKNALLKGMNLKEGGTTIERNGQIGGHKA
jgi:DNA polymerase V